MPQERNEFIDRIEQGLERLQERIDTMTINTATSVSDSSHKATEKSKEFLELVHRQKEDLKTRLAQFKKAQSEATSEIKAGVESAYHDLEKAVKNAVDRF